jgi:hypothetical protein
MNLQFLNRPIGCKALLVSALALSVLSVFLWKIGTVEVSSDALVPAVMLAAALVFLVLVSLLGASKTPNPVKAFRRYLIYVGCGIGVGVLILLWKR